MKLHNVTCACGAKMMLRRSKWGLFYGCTKFPACKLMHSCHQSDGSPMGRPGTEAERKARNRTHKVFDTLWQENKFSPVKPMHRRGAYAWMQRVMGLTAAEAHIGNFTVEQCERLIALVEQYFKEQNDLQAARPAAL